MAKSLNVAMWGRAVRVIPRVSREEWGALDVISRWLIATRSAALVMTLNSAVAAGLLAFRDARFDFVLWFLVTAGLLLAHATNNLVNDLTDHLKGVDRDNYFRAQYGPQPLEHGLMTRGEMLVYIAVTGLLALGAGLALVAVRGAPILFLLAAGAFFVLFYTWPLKYIGLGELAVLVVWGPLMVGGGYYAITGTVTPEVLLASLPLALAATTVLLGKHTDKLEADRQKGIRTLPVLLGEKGARALMLVCLTLPYAIVLGLVVGRAFSPLLLLTGFALPWYLRAVRVLRAPRPSERPPQYPAEAWPLWFVAFAFQHTRRFGFLFLLGLVADVVVHRAFGVF